MSDSRRWSLVLLLLLFVAPCVRGDDKQLKIGCYNVENLMDVWDDPYTDDEQTPVKQYKEINAVAKLIDQVDPDIMAISELENEGVLRSVVHEFLVDKGYNYVTSSMTNDGRGVRLGLISRKPIISVTSHRFQDLRHPDSNKRYRFARDLFYIKIQATPTRVLHVFAVHLKSMRDSTDDPKSEHWRSAEAIGARRIIGDVLKAEPDAWVVMLGDFNSVPDSPSLKIILEPTAPGAPFLVDTYASVPAKDRITYLPSKYRSNIDYILASPALASRLVKDSQVLIKSESMLVGSDHTPLGVTFNIGD